MPEDEKAIRELIAAWLAATESGEHEKVLAMMTDDVVFQVSGRPPFGKKEFAENTAKMKGVGSRAQSEILEIQIVGTWAYIRTHLRIEAGGHRRAGNTLSVLRKDPVAGWQIARDANMLAPEA